MRAIHITFIFSDSCCERYFSKFQFLKWKKATKPLELVSLFIWSSLPTHQALLFSRLIILQGFNQLKDLIQFSSCQWVACEQPRSASQNNSFHSFLQLISRACQRQTGHSLPSHWLVPWTLNLQLLFIHIYNPTKIFCQQQISNLSTHLTAKKPQNNKILAGSKKHTETQHCLPEHHAQHIDQDQWKQPHCRTATWQRLSFPVHYVGQRCPWVSL